MERKILHIDFNNFYSSVESLKNTELSEHPLAVAGDPQKRHGIILAKNEIAKRFGVRTGEPIWQAKQKCPALLTIAPHFNDYVRISEQGRKIIEEYSSRIEPFGLDESWVDISNIATGFLDAEHIANELRMRIKKELGISVSIGVADNKPFAKLGSDLKKPDAVTVLCPKDYRSRIWPLPVSNLLFIGRATELMLLDLGIETIGDLARSNLDLLKTQFGKWGVTLHIFANGADDSPVRFSQQPVAPKSIGNGVTTPYDLKNDTDVKLTLTMLCESVASRLRENCVRARTIHVSIRDVGLSSFTRQKKLEHPTYLASELLCAAMELFQANYNWEVPIRSLTVTTSDFIMEQTPTQITLWQEEEKRIRKEKLAHAVDDIRSRYGHHAVLRGSLLQDMSIGALSPKDEHIVFPRM